jgi:hypothetical protein
MRRALREHVVPNLRARGFRGSFPHFSRVKSDRIDLLTFQFSIYGPTLYVEIATCGPDGVVYTTGEKIEPHAVRVRHTGTRRRLGRGADDFAFAVFRLQKYVNGTQNPLSSYR